ncbi:sulfite exporter TauE/SafE family protein [Fictibacillus iocasae]|uniref:Probable membrane transporter protein n=1 Tax=Fictibacillus iocasae TaxID=2715437 RepID=A0ABW2NQ85_9BACL
MTTLLFLIGICATFLGTLAGGGGILSFPAMLLLGVPPHIAIASNKFSNTFSSFSSFYVLLRKKEVTLRTLVVPGFFSLAGGIAGSQLSVAIPSHVMNVLALFLLVAAFMLTYLKRPDETIDFKGPIPSSTYPLLFGIGAYDGMFGPGQGTLQMNVFLNKGFSVIRAIAFTRFNTFLSCIGAAVSYIASGFFLAEVAIPLAAGSLIGAQLAVRSAKKLSKKHILMMVRALTLLLILQLALQM